MTRRQSAVRSAVSLTVDAVVFRVVARRLEVLLVERGSAPFRGRWALPGGFVDETESLEEAARRELEEETGLLASYLEQLYTFGAPDRDPRGRVVSVAYYALIGADEAQGEVRGGSDATSARWHPAEAPPALAFDHGTILRRALERLRAKVRYAPVGFELLAPEFTLTELQSLYETLLGRSLDKRNFRRKLLGSGLLEDTGRLQSGVPYRAPRLYRFDRERYGRLVERGFEFAV